VMLRCSSTLARVMMRVLILSLYPVSSLLLPPTKKQVTAGDGAAAVPAAATVITGLPRGLVRTISYCHRGFLSGPAAGRDRLRLSFLLLFLTAWLCFCRPSATRAIPQPGRAVLLLPARRVLLRPLRHLGHMIPIKGARRLICSW
jgi:hypothetical protein